MKKTILCLTLFITSCATQQQEKSFEADSGTYNFDLSSPSKTYQSCANGSIHNRAQHIPLDFAKAYLSYCVTREGKVHDIENLMLILGFMQVFGGASQENEKHTRLYIIFEKYGGLENFEENVEQLTTKKLGNLYLELTAYFNDVGRLGSGVSVPKIEKFTITGNYAKGFAANTKDSQESRHEVHFKKIGNNWLIHVDETTWNN